MSVYQIDFHQPIAVHFIGIGGISMSGLASILLGAGFTVTGSDAKASPLTADLEKRGALIHYPQSADNIPEICDVVVYTAAVHPDNPEYAEAVRRNLPMLSRAQLLGQIMDNYEASVAVAGTHGKTTTTSMLAHITLAGSLDPTISVGGMLHLIGGNIRVGASETFVTEACEYTNSFLSLKPKYGIILNIDADHLDFFKDLDDIRRSFHAFAEGIRPDGTLILDGHIPHPEEITAGLSCSVVTVGGDDSDYRVTDMQFDELGYGSFTLSKGDQPISRFHLHVPGSHNIYNAASAIVTALLMGVSPDKIQEGLDTFTGTDRRFQHKGKVRGVTVIDDYAHHPTEILATQSAAGNLPHNTLWCVFQPHTYTRTASLMDEFAGALKGFDRVLLMDIYAARETDTLGISSQTLADKIAALGGNVLCTGTFEATQSYLKEHLAEGDVLITMGAGDVFKVGEHLLSEEQ